MSQLRVTATGQSDFYLNVLNFDSPITGEMNSAQTKSQVQYFPIKAFQPDLTVDVVFPSEAQWQQWQSWARQNMLNTQNSNSTGNPGVTLNWPERSINNWTALIPGAKAGGLRANYAPRTRIEFQLIVSLVSGLQIFSSFGTSIESGILGAGSNLDNLFSLPANFSGGALTSGNAGLLSSLGSSFSGISSLIPGLSGL